MVQRLFGCLTVITFAAVAMAQQSAGWHDDLLEQMVGNWKLDGIVMGQPAHHSVTAQWTLGHQFLQIHEQTSSDAPATESRYDATWFLGFDDVSERYVLHLMDVFGGRYSETLGYGTREPTSCGLYLSILTAHFTRHGSGSRIRKAGSGTWSKRIKGDNGRHSRILD
jgi:hypothetical protein